jgi:hypothetical protein
VKPDRDVVETRDNSYVVSIGWFEGLGWLYDQIGHVFEGSSMTSERIQSTSISISERLSSGPRIQGC